MLQKATFPNPYHPRIQKSGLTSHLDKPPGPSLMTFNTHHVSVIGVADWLIRALSKVMRDKFCALPWVTYVQLKLLFACKHTCVVIGRLF